MMEQLSEDSFKLYNLEKKENFREELFEQILKDIQENRIQGLIVDYKLDTLDEVLEGIEVVNYMHESVPEFPVIILTDVPEKSKENDKADPDKVYAKEVFMKPGDLKTKEMVYHIIRNLERYTKRRSEFEKAGRNDLDNDYRNLMYSCPICNRLKSDAFEGKIQEEQIINPYFYNPVDIDYNTIFTRDDKGRIQSTDELGKAMIKRLQLYRPTKQMAWFLDELKQTYDALEIRMQAEQNLQKQEKLKIAYDKIGNVLFKRHRYFVHSFMSEKTGR